jgi:sugar phosphate isomerase/epimerase
MLVEMAGLGFEHVELSHGIRITLVPGILRALEQGVVKVSSTHNFCPLPTGVTHAAPNLFEPSSRDRGEREQWLRHTKRSIDFAAQVGARALVCHLGSVRFFWFNPGRNLRSYLHEHSQAGRAGDDTAYRALVERAQTKLRKRMAPFWQFTRDSVAAALDHAADRGISLGFENREKFDELPLDADFVEFLGALPPSARAGYWHDSGHADIKESMGLLDHRRHLEQLKDRVIGFHLHDVNAHGQDHQPLGAGHVDFKMVSEFWRPGHLLTLEFGPRVTADEVRASKERIEALM